jgi:hypothetical protein
LLSVLTASPTDERASASAGPESLAGAPLDLHKGIEALRATRCERWPPELRLENTLGDLIPGRCKSVNLCDYCARLAAVETAEVLALDATANEAPRVWSVLTTRTPAMDMRRFQQGRQNVRRAVRRRWPEARCATLVEFQTGRGRNAGGQRRPHWNDMWKGIPPHDVPALVDVLATTWCKHVDAEPSGQFAGTVSEVGGLMRYLALHFQKEDQQPPKGWRGHRFRAMAGYLDRPMAQAREEARQSLRFKREVWKLRDSGMTALEIDEAAHRALYEANEMGWELVRLSALPVDFDADGMPCAWEPTTTPIRR